jgi:uncharacterized membrane-anchored protein YitT (DUF2179 family)
MEKSGVKLWARRIFFIAMGNACNALALNLFLTENEIAAGGFFGIAIVLNHFFYVPVGTFVLVLTVPLLIWAWFVKGWKYVLFTLLTTASYSLFVDGSALFLHRVTENLLLAAVCGGALIGLGAVMYLQGETSSGGTDLLARLLVTWRRELSLGTMFMIVDGAVILASVIVTRNIELGLYAAISLGVCSYVNDLMIHGMNKAEVFFIIPSHDPEPIARAIMNGLDRGVTSLEGRGMYAGESKQVLMTVVKPRQSHRLKALVKEIDPAAFVFRAQANEVVGEGFLDVDAGETKK